MMRTEDADYYIRNPQDFVGLAVKSTNTGNKGKIVNIDLAVDGNTRDDCFDIAWDNGLTTSGMFFLWLKDLAVELVGDKE